MNTDKILLSLIRKQGILVDTYSTNTSISFNYPDETQYKRSLGAVCKKNWRGIVTNIYLVYEDFDNSIKYYDYPQEL